MSPITTHVLDLSNGRPAAGVRVVLHRMTRSGEWEQLGTGATDDDGRLGDLLPGPAAVETGVHRLTYATGEYFERQGVHAFHPHVEIIFSITDAGEHHHVPLLLSPFGYTTYRGS